MKSKYTVIPEEISSNNKYTEKGNQICVKLTRVSKINEAKMIGLKGDMDKPTIIHRELTSLLVTDRT